MRISCFSGLGWAAVMVGRNGWLGVWIWGCGDRLGLVPVATEEAL